MATRKKAKETKEKKEGMSLILADDDFEVSNVHSFKASGKVTSRIGFTLKMWGSVTLYNLVAVETEDGKQFISFPERKGKDGNYYKEYYVEFGEDAQEKILQAVYDAE